jgi:hypothetical protein
MTIKPAIRSTKSSDNTTIWMGSRNRSSCSSVSTNGLNPARRRRAVWAAVRRRPLSLQPRKLKRTAPTHSEHRKSTMTNTYNGGESGARESKTALPPLCTRSPVPVWHHHHTHVNGMGGKDRNGSCIPPLSPVHGFQLHPSYPANTDRKLKVDSLKLKTHANHIAVSYRTLEMLPSPRKPLLPIRLASRCVRKGIAIEGLSKLVVKDPFEFLTDVLACGFVRHLSRMPGR